MSPIRTTAVLILNGVIISFLLVIMAAVGVLG